MNALEDINSNNDEDNQTTRINRDGGSQSPEKTSVGNVLFFDSNKNTEISAAMSQNVPQSANFDDKEVTNENSGGTIADVLNENIIKSDKIQSELTEISKEFINTDAGKGSGDYASNIISNIDDNVDIDLNDPKHSITDVIDEKDETNDSFLNKCVEIELKKVEDADENDDDDIELRWDDDDSSNQALGDGNGNSDPKNNDILLEEQLLEEPSDINSKEMPEMHSDGNFKNTADSLDADILNENSDENIFTGNKTLKEIETTYVSGKTREPDIPPEKGVDENSDNILEDEVLKENDINTEAVNSPKTNFLTEESVDQDDINDLEDELLKEVTEICNEASDVDQEEEIPVEKSIDKNTSEPLEETESAENNLPTENLDDIIEEDKLLAEYENNTETETAKFQITSFTDVLNTQADDVMLEESLLKEADSDVESSGIIPEKEVQTNIDLDDNDDVLPEETEAAEVFTETDVIMDVDDEKEVELPKDVESQCDTPMDVDITDQAIEDQLNMDDNTDQSMDDQADMENKDLYHPVDQQLNVKNTDETPENINQSADEQNDKITEKIDHPIEGLAKIVEINKDTHIEEETKIEEKHIEAEIEKENIKQPTNNQSEKEDISEDQLIEDSNTMEQSNNSPLQIDLGTTSMIPNVPIEGLEKSLTEKKDNSSLGTFSEKVIEDPPEPLQEEITLETEVKNKSEPEKVIEDPPEPLQEEITLETEVKNKSEPEKIIEDPPEPLQEKITLETEVKNKSESEKVIEDPPEPLQEKITLETEVKHKSKPEKVIEDPPEPLQEKITLETEVKNKSEPENLEEYTESVNQDKNLDDNNDTDEFPSNNSSICQEDSPVPIRTDHGLHRPDVMLEIPTQELIDMEDTDLSMNLDQSEVIDSPNDVDKNFDDNIPHDDKIVPDEDTVNENTVVVTEPTVDEVQKDINIVESSNNKNIEDMVQTTMEKKLENMLGEVELAVKEVPECVASTSQTEPDIVPSTPFARMTPDTSDEVPEVSDSLGLLAESSGRMMEDDEEPDDDDEGDDDDDFEDESSNQISAEQSEDSNPAALESEPAGDQEDKELETPDPKDVQFQFMISSVDGNLEDKGEKMDIEVEEYGTVELQAESINEMNEETQSAVDALLKNNEPKVQIEDPKKTTEQMDIETVKLSDTSDNEVEVEQTVVDPNKELKDKSKQSPSKSPSKSDQSPKQSPDKELSQSPCKQSPSKMKKLEITMQEASSVVNIVDLEESSSSEDDIQEVEKQPEPDITAEDQPTTPDADVTNVNIPTGIEIMCTSGGNTSEIVTKEGEVVISGVPKPPPHKPARLNTSEVSIKTVSTTEPLVIPETKINEQTLATQSKPKLSLEIFSLDSDDEDSAAKEKSATTSPHKMTALELEKARETSKCINYCCTSGNKVPYRLADASVVAYYDAGRKRRSMVCQPCAEVVANRTKNLIQGIKDFTPLLDLEMGKLSQDLVEISDSESEDEDMTPEEPKESIGEKGAKFLEDNLAKYLNDIWNKYEMDVRLKETQIMLDDEIEKLEEDSKEIDAMLNECQIATDKLRSELYATFECRRQELPALVLYDTPESKFIGLEAEATPPFGTAEATEPRQAKRRMSSASETPAKRPAIPLGYAPLDAPDAKEKAAIPGPDTKLDDDKDISVVKLSAEAAPADLPPPGEISRPPLRVSMAVYAMKNAFGPWLKGKILEMQPKNPSAGNPFSLCRVKFDHKAKTNGKVLPARCIAYSEPADVRMTIGTRLIALFKDSNKRESYYSGVVAEIPNPVNNYRYLVFFDDGYAQYVQHQYTRLVCESSPLVWEEVHPFSREFVREYLLAYPERPMVRLHEGQHLKTEWNGKWWSSRVTRVDASLAQVMFVGDGRREWIYRGSTRLAPLYLELRAAERHRPRPMPRSKAQPRLNMPYVEYTRSDEQEPNKQAEAQTQQQQIQSEEIRRQRAVAKKSTSVPPVAPPPQQQMPNNNLDTVTSRVVYYTPKNAVKPLKMVPHRCSTKCKRSDVLSLKELRTYNPLAKPLLSGWERQIVRFKGHKEVMYRAPCGRRLRNMRELHHYLRAIDSDLPVDLFDFHYSTHCLAEFVLNKCLVGKKDLSHGKENVPVPCVNYYDDSLPEFCSYNTERTPTAGVPLNLEPEFLCGCDCTDDCQDKSKCACWKMTLEGARTIGLDGPNVGYVYKRLPEPLPSGIYECNSRCKCKHTCLNRVAQHPLQLKLQVFKTLNRGWGIRALNDVPKGSFLCVYAGNLLTDATANLDGLNEGDEYLAELDYIEVVEQMKEGYEEDIPEADKKLDKKELAKEGEDSEEDDPSSSEEEDTASKSDKEDDDFRPGYIGLGVMEFNKRLRKREKSKKDKEKSATDDKEKEKDTKETKDAKESNAEEDCITISDDEEVREPSRFMVQAGMGANEFISKYKSVRTLFGKDEACYIMDAKVQGNIGRYLNHSCCPNVFVQNVFVDTHDPRFPWVAFFALSHVKAGTELTWNYNYDVGSVPGKILYCFCGAPNCRGRLL